MKQRINDRFTTHKERWPGNPLFIQGGGNVNKRTMHPIGSCLLCDLMGLFRGVRTFPPQFLLLIYVGSYL